MLLSARSVFSGSAGEHENLAVAGQHWTESQQSLCFSKEHDDGKVGLSPYCHETFGWTAENDAASRISPIKTQHRIWKRQALKSLPLHGCIFPSSQKHPRRKTPNRRPILASHFTDFQRSGNIVYELVSAKSAKCSK